MQSSLVYVVVDNGVDVVVNGRAVRALVVDSNYDEVVDTDLSQGTSSMLSTLSWCMSSSTEHNDVVIRDSVVVVVVDVSTYIYCIVLDETTMIVGLGVVVVVELIRLIPSRGRR